MERITTMEPLSSRRALMPTNAFVWIVVGAAWSVTMLAALSDHDRLLSHHTLLGNHHFPEPGPLLLFLGAWQFMTGAMMLPSSRPMVAMFARASRQQRHPRLVLATFITAYFAVWTGYALVALTGDALLHRAVERWRWLDERPWLIAGSVLMLAGAFQFSPLKERCLDACRSPYSFLLRHYDRGLQPAWALGIRHGLFCLGCCWALMITMFAVGVGSLGWMMALTGVMLVEKTMPWGRRLVPVVGITLLVWGGIVLLRPAEFLVP